MSVFDKLIEGGKDGGKYILIVPPLKTVVAGGLGGILASGEGIPLSACSKNPEHTVQHISIGETWAASIGALDGLG